ncbi:hypothetical protein CONPUDRAFT_158606 [Coniophora puteana RWD-64-598 SS2]|uniref:Uncharacterized protein n=1 Tax=Coniophora puteana (strain RWD-64-598) TaxID=741705 RepID=A0A5M3MA54_CONPW|nr:uncharacterized protein CONPUDRAFT_158606 [Coniophora puteana RWD-64-598 SS2]EIW75826.1 hypothetical protein CONPUDRAFT_158606 [Coniophora puteana RWD-64-598 SS2]
MPTAVSHIQRVDVETCEGSRSSDAGLLMHHTKLPRTPVCLNAVLRDTIQVDSLPNFAGALVEHVCEGIKCKGPGRLSASSAAISTRVAALDIIADPLPQTVTCLRQHRLSAGGRGLWLSLMHDTMLATNERLQIPRVAGQVALQTA